MTKIYMRPVRKKTQRVQGVNKQTVETGCKGFRLDAKGCIQYTRGADKMQRVQRIHKGCRQDATGADKMQRVQRIHKGCGQDTTGADKKQRVQTRCKGCRQDAEGCIQYSKGADKIKRV